MSGSEHARPVWLTREQRDALRSLMFGEATAGTWRTLAPVVNQWDAAPADPAEAVRAAFQYLYPEMPMESEVRAVLRALGHPTIEGDAS